MRPGLNHVATPVPRLPHPAPPPWRPRGPDAPPPALAPRRVVVCVPGLATALLKDGQPSVRPLPHVTTLVERCFDPDADPAFGDLKGQLFEAQNFGCRDFLNYSYDGSGHWS